MKKNLRLFLVVVVVLALMLTIVACGKKKPAETTVKDTTAETITTTAPTTTVKDPNTSTPITTKAPTTGTPDTSAPVTTPATSAKPPVTQPPATLPPVVTTAEKPEEPKFPQIASGSWTVEDGVYTSNSKSSIIVLGSYDDIFAGYTFEFCMKKSGAEDAGFLFGINDIDGDGKFWEGTDVEYVFYGAAMNAVDINAFWIRQKTASVASSWGGWQQVQYKPANIPSDNEIRIKFTPSLSEDGKKVLITAWFTYDMTSEEPEWTLMIENKALATVAPDNLGGGFGFRSTQVGGSKFWGFKVTEPEIGSGASGEWLESDTDVKSTVPNSIKVLGRDFATGYFGTTMTLENAATTSNGIIFNANDLDGRFWENKGTSYYFLAADKDNKLVLSKIVDGTTTVLGAADIAGATKTIELKVSVSPDGVIKGYANGFLLIDVIDEAPLTGKMYGVRAGDEGVTFATAGLVKEDIDKTLADDYSVVFGDVVADFESIKATADNTILFAKDKVAKVDGRYTLDYSGCDGQTGLIISYAQSGSTSSYYYVYTMETGLYIQKVDGSTFTNFAVVSLDGFEKTGDHTIIVETIKVADGLQIYAYVDGKLAVNKIDTAALPAGDTYGAILSNGAVVHKLSYFDCIPAEYAGYTAEHNPNGDMYFDANGLVHGGKNTIALKNDDSVDVAAGKYVLKFNNVGTGDNGLVIAHSRTSDHTWEGRGTSYYFIFLNAKGVHIGKTTLGAWKGCATFEFAKSPVVDSKLPEGVKKDDYTRAGEHTLEVHYSGVASEGASGVFYVYLDGLYLGTWTDTAPLTGTGYGVRSGAEGTVFTSVERHDWRLENFYYDPSGSRDVSEINKDGTMVLGDGSLVLSSDPLEKIAGRYTLDYDTPRGGVGLVFGHNRAGGKVWTGAGTSYYFLRADKYVISAGQTNDDPPVALDEVVTVKVTLTKFTADGNSTNLRTIQFEKRTDKNAVIPPHKDDSYSAVGDHTISVEYDGMGMFTMFYDGECIGYAYDDAPLTGLYYGVRNGGNKQVVNEIKYEDITFDAVSHEKTGNVVKTTWKDGSVTYTNGTDTEGGRSQLTVGDSTTANGSGTYYATLTAPIDHHQCSAFFFAGEEGMTEMNAFRGKAYHVVLNESGKLVLDKPDYKADGSWNEWINRGEKVIGGDFTYGDAENNTVHIKVEYIVKEYDDENSVGYIWVYYRLDESDDWTLAIRYTDVDPYTGTEYGVNGKRPSCVFSDISYEESVTELATEDDNWIYWFGPWQKGETLKLHYNHNAIALKKNDSVAANGAGIYTYKFNITDLADDTGLIFAGTMGGDNPWGDSRYVGSDTSYYMAFVCDVGVRLGKVTNGSWSTVRTLDFTLPSGDNYDRPFDESDENGHTMTVKYDGKGYMEIYIDDVFAGSYYDASPLTGGAAYGVRLANNGHGTGSIDYAEYTDTTEKLASGIIKITDANGKVSYARGTANDYKLGNTPSAQGTYYVTFDSSAYTQQCTFFYFAGKDVVTADKVYNRNEAHSYAIVLTEGGQLRLNVPTTGSWWNTPKVFTILSSSGFKYGDKVYVKVDYRVTDGAGYINAYYKLREDAEWKHALSHKVTNPLTGTEYGIRFGTPSPKVTDINFVEDTDIYTSVGGTVIKDSNGGYIAGIDKDYNGAILGTNANGVSGRYYFSAKIDSNPTQCTYFTFGGTADSLKSAGNHYAILIQNGAASNLKIMKCTTSLDWGTGINMTNQSLTAVGYEWEDTIDFMVTADKVDSAVKISVYYKLEGDTDWTLLPNSTWYDTENIYDGGKYGIVMKGRNITLSGVSVNGYDANGDWIYWYGNTWKPTEDVAGNDVDERLTLNGTGNHIALATRPAGTNGAGRYEYNFNFDADYIDYWSDTESKTKYVDTGLIIAGTFNGANPNEGAGTSYYKILPYTTYKKNATTGVVSVSASGIFVGKIVDNTWHELARYNLLRQNSSFTESGEHTVVVEYNGDGWMEIWVDTVYAGSVYDNQGEPLTGSAYGLIAVNSGHGTESITCTATTTTFPTDYEAATSGKGVTKYTKNDVVYYAPNSKGTINHKFSANTAAATGTYYVTFNTSKATDQCTFLVFAGTGYTGGYGCTSYSLYINEGSGTIGLNRPNTTAASKPWDVVKAKAIPGFVYGDSVDVKLEYAIIGEIGYITAWYKHNGQGDWTFAFNYVDTAPRTGTEWGMAFSTTGTTMSGISYTSDIPEYVYHYGANWNPTVANPLTYTAAEKHIALKTSPAGTNGAGTYTYKFTNNTTAGDNGFIFAGTIAPTNLWNGGQTGYYLVFVRDGCISLGKEYNGWKEWQVKLAAIKEQDEHEITVYYDGNGYMRVWYNGTEIGQVTDTSINGAPLKGTIYGIRGNNNSYTATSLVYTNDNRHHIAVSTDNGTTSYHSSTAMAYSGGMVLGTNGTDGTGTYYFSAKIDSNPTQCTYFTFGGTADPLKTAGNHYAILIQDGNPSNLKIMKCTTSLDWGTGINITNQSLTDAAVGYKWGETIDFKVVLAKVDTGVKISVYYMLETSTEWTLLPNSEWIDTAPYTGTNYGICMKGQNITISDVSATTEIE